MTTYLGEKAVGIGTVKATIGVTGDVLHDSTLKGNGNTEPLGVDTEVIATTTQVGNLSITLNAAIDGQAEAIVKTRNDFEVADQNIRADMNAKDLELETILNDHEERLSTLRTDHDDLGDDISDIQAKIPQSASGSNPLITKQQLLDEEMDIRSDLIDIQGELQTQITGQASEIAKVKQEVAGLSSLSFEIVDELPAVGKEGVIYLVPSGGEAPNLRDEYVWVNGAFEVIGSTQVDLTGYVKNTDYAATATDTAGIVKVNSALGLYANKGNLHGYVKTKSAYDTSQSETVISKGTLENIKNDLVKRAVTENDIVLTDEEKAAAQAWLGIDTLVGDIESALAGV